MYPTQVDEQAPVTSAHEIEIRAPRQVVWDLMVDVDGWDSWSPDISRSSTPSALGPGVTFEWETFGLTVTSTVYAVEPPARVMWGGPAAGIDGIHEWRFEEVDLGDAGRGTRVSTHESWSGEPVEEDVEKAQRDLDGSLVSWLDALRTESERRAGA